MGSEGSGCGIRGFWWWGRPRDRSGPGRRVHKVVRKWRMARVRGRGRGAGRDGGPVVRVHRGRPRGSACRAGVERRQHVDRAHPAPQHGAAHDDRAAAGDVRPGPVPPGRRSRDGEPPGGRHRAAAGGLARVRPCGRLGATAVRVVRLRRQQPADPGACRRLLGRAGAKVARRGTSSRRRPTSIPAGRGDWSARTSTASRSRPAPRTTDRASRCCSSWRGSQPGGRRRCPPCSSPSARRSRWARARRCTTSARGCTPTGFRQPSAGPCGRWWRSTGSAWATAGSCPSAPAASVRCGYVTT